MTTMSNPSIIPGYHQLNIVIRRPPFTSIQVKTHRKKRINKKWQKRYGYQQICLPYNAAEILQHGSTLYVYPEMEARVYALMRHG